MVMRRNAMRKNLLQSILKSFGRYIAIVMIIALGASMFVGLLMTKADMVATGQKFMDEQNMFDLRLVSTYGWGPEQLAAIEELDFVARDKVRCSLVGCNMLPVPERKFSVIAGTVASERLDCIIALVTKLSREKAKVLVNSGLVSVNHFPETKCDAILCQNDLLSVRGYGRFKVAELGDMTRKGRTRTVIHKMI